MASIAMVCRQSARSTIRCMRARAAQTREFNDSRQRWAASNFVMPAMSPTMTEGNIASWKVKEGDSFSTGDVLLEIETDKAQMDVEAQEDGKLAKITEQDGAKSIKVGKRIAVLAEPDDDLSSLEIPEEDASSSSPTGKSSSSAQSDSSDEATAKKEKQSSSDTADAQESSRPADHHTAKTPSEPQKYPLYPSVQHLLHLNNIPLSDADSIPATGPNGRLLKGDVLSYLGSISKSYPSEQSERLSKLSHLDLSNIKPAAPRRQTAPKDSPAEKADSKAAPPPEAQATQVAVPISLAAVFATQKRIQESLGLTLPLSTFIARASEIANENLPRAKGTAASADELFDAVLGLDSVKSRVGTRGHYTPMITALPPPGVAPLLASIRGGRPSRKVDIIDVLTGAKPRASPAPRTFGALGAGGADNVFSVSVGPGEEKRARTYLERVKTVLEREPGRCVL